MFRGVLTKSRLNVMTEAAVSPRGWKCVGDIRSKRISREATSPHSPLWSRTPCVNQFYAQFPRRSSRSVIIRSSTNRQTRRLADIPAPRNLSYVLFIIESKFLGVICLVRRHLFSRNGSEIPYECTHKITGVKIISRNSSLKVRKHPKGHGCTW